MWCERNRRNVTRPLWFMGQPAVPLILELAGTHQGPHLMAQALLAMGGLAVAYFSFQRR